MGLLKLGINEFAEIVWPLFWWYPTHSADKNGMDGARRNSADACLTGNEIAILLQVGQSQLEAWGARWTKRRELAPLRGIAS